MCKPDRIFLHYYLLLFIIILLLKVSSSPKDLEHGRLTWPQLLHGIGMGDFFLKYLLLQLRS